jgi:acyl carrier protein
MDLQNFIDRLIEIFEDADPGTVKPEVKFREIEGYSSLTAFLIIGMVNDEYSVNFTGEDLRKSNTIEDIFSIVKSRR